MKKCMRLSWSILTAALLVFAACKQPTITTTAEKPKPDGNDHTSIAVETCTVTFNLDGGSGLPQSAVTKTVVKGKPVVQPSPDPVKAGFIFQYWASEQNGGTSYDFKTEINEDITLWAVWKTPEAGTIEVSFDLDGGEGSIASQYITPGEKVSIPSVIPKKSDAFFKYWSKDGSTIYDFNTAETKAVTLTAVYYDIESDHTRIYDIQGTSHKSPLDGKKYPVTVPGVVTGIFYKKTTPEGFYIQDQAGDGNAVTSDGIFVYCGKNGKNFPAGLAAGDMITLQGWVKEHAWKIDNGGTEQVEDLSTTQINLKQGSVNIIQKAEQLPNKKMLLPEPVLLSALDFAGKPVSTAAIGSLEPDREAIDFYESLESMRVKIHTPKVVAKHNGNTYFLAPHDTPSECLSYRGGMMYNSYNATPLITVYGNKCFEKAADGGFAAPHPGVGSVYTGNIIGVIGFDSAKFSSNYGVFVTDTLPPVTEQHLTPETSTITFNENTLNVVSYNLKNFSAGNPNDANRATQFAKHFVEGLQNPDVICLIEIQDDSGQGKKNKTEYGDDGVVTSEETLQLLIENITNAGGAIYKKVCINPENNIDGGAPGGNIRCAYLYRTDRVELVADADGIPTAAEKSDAAAVIEAGGLRLQQNPARIGLGSDAFERTRKSLVAHFKLKTGEMAEKDFFIINNHLSSKRGDARIWGPNQPVVRKSEPKRHKQAKVVKDFIDSILQERSDAVIVAVGDYNDFWFSETMNIIKGSSLKNAVEEAPMNERYTFVYNAHSQTLDNILVPHHVSVDTIDVLNLNAETTGLSDHDPVFVQLSW